jgi:hypothetical protein
MKPPGNRASSGALALLAAAFAAFAATWVDAAVSRNEAAARTAANRDLVAALELTDLCLFTEARYTRHPSQADLHTAFQDHPRALEHFPSGSLLPPPAILTEHHGRLDR